MAEAGPGFDDRVAEAKATGVLNLSYLPPAAVQEAIATVLATPGVHVGELDVSSCALDELPALVSSLSALRCLRAKYNRLSRLPVELLGALPRLEAVDLEGNRVAVLEEGALPALGDRLRRLNLSGNGLAALPDSVGRCRALEALTLANNPLTHLPEALAACPALSHLDVSSCRLVALPAALAGSKSLQRFFCQNNDLPRVPTALGHLPNLKEWNLRANRLPLKYEQARERGLAKFLAFLREEEEIERLQEIERNRPVGVASGPCMVYRCKAVLDDAVAAARQGQPTDGFAWIRQGWAAAQHRSCIYVFGGMVVKEEGRKTAELLVLDRDTMEWRVQPTRGDRPVPRDGHAFVADPTGNQLLCFGGRSSSGRRMNDLHALDLATWTWYVPKQEGAALPPPREHAAAAVAPDGRLLLFGGRTNGARLNDLWSWDSASGLWEQLPVHGTAPTPRQGAAACFADGQLYIMGGSSNFVLSDCLAYNLDAQEWRVLGTEGHSKAAARAGGHVITHVDGEIWMFGGRDALGAQVSYLLKLRPKAGGAWYEWVETEFAMQPNRSRVVLFDSSNHLCIAQCGHPLHKLNVSPEQIERGSCIWDVVQRVPLSAVQEKAVRPEDLEGANPKRERIKHATLIAAKLPPGFSGLSPREEQLLAACDAFRQRWALAQGGTEGTAPTRLEPCLTLLNECGVRKCVCTTLRRTALPHTELHDLEGIAQFVAEFFTAEPLEDPIRPPTHLVSPWSLLEWQAGDSFDLATLACSLLLGAGYNAFVAVGYAASKQLALCDQSRTECPFLEEYGVEAPPYGELPEAEASFEEPPAEAAPVVASVAAEEAEAEAAGTAAEGAVAPDRQLEAPAAEAAAEAARAVTPATTGRRHAGSAAGSRPATSASAPRSRLATAAAAEGSSAAAAAAVPAAAAAAESAAGQEVQEGQAEEAGTEETPAPAPHRPKRYIHAFVLIKAGRREVPHPLLLDPTTGLLHSLDAAPCTGVECAWNDRNWWASLQTDGLVGFGSGLAELALTDWTFSNPNCWLPLLVNKEDHQAEAATMTTALSMRSSKAESLLRSHAGDARGTPALHRSSSNFAHLAPGPSKTPLPGAVPSTAFSPRSQALLSSTSAAMAAASASASGGLPTGAAGKPPSGGLALQHLALGGRSGTPRLGNYAPTRELQDPSMAFLSPEETAAGQRSSLLPGASTAALLPAPSLPHALSTLGLAAAGGAATPHGGGGEAPPPPGMPPPAEMPLSWVPALAISRERLDMRCPRGTKVVQYRQARRELFARYGECGRWDGLVERLTTYDAATGAPICVLELFARRRDCLERRLAHPAQRSVLACYAGGAAECVKTVRVVRGLGASRSMELSFYAENRTDGLLRRQHGNGTLEEWFLPGSRPDGLVHRTAQYAAAGAAAAAPAEQSGAAGAKARPSQRSSVRALHRASSIAPLWEAPQQPAALICEEFSHSRGQAVKQLGAAAAGEAAAAGPGVVRRCFDLAAGRLELVVMRPAAGAAAVEGMEAHAEAGAAHVKRAYGIEGELLEGGSAAACPSPEQQQREYAALQAACRAAQAAARSAEEESTALVLALQQQEQQTALVTPHWDATRVKVEESDDVRVEGEEGHSYDFLHHFLPHTGARDLTAAEAAAARQACLDAFDDRQAARLHLLRSRLAEGGAELARLRALLADELHHLADPERVLREEAAAAFRLRCAQRRLEEHAPRAAAKRRELEGRLDGDKRLATALVAEAEARR